MKLINDNLKDGIKKSGLIFVGAVVAAGARPRAGSGRPGGVSSRVGVAGLRPGAVVVLPAPLPRRIIGRKRAVGGVVIGAVIRVPGRLLGGRRRNVGVRVRGRVPRRRRQREVVSMWCSTCCKRMTSVRNCRTSAFWDGS